MKSLQTGGPFYMYTQTDRFMENAHIHGHYLFSRGVRSTQGLTILWRLENPVVSYPFSHVHQAILNHAKLRRTVDA